MLAADTHLESTKKWFDKEGIKVAGYFQWKQVTISSPCTTVLS